MVSNASWRKWGACSPKGSNTSLGLWTWKEHKNQSEQMKWWFSKGIHPKSNPLNWDLGIIGKFGNRSMESRLFFAHGKSVKTAISLGVHTKAVGAKFALQVASSKENVVKWKAAWEKVGPPKTLVGVIFSLVFSLKKQVCLNFKVFFFYEEQIHPKVAMRGFLQWKTGPLVVSGFPGDYT